MRTMELCTVFTYTVRTIDGLDGGVVDADGLPGNLSEPVWICRAHGKAGTDVMKSGGGATELYRRRHGGCRATRE